MKKTLILLSNGQFCALQQIIMMKVKGIFLRLSKWRGLLLFLLAVLLLEVLSVAQYFFTHNLLEEELEKHAELELTMKAIIMKQLIDDSEHTLKSHIMEVKNNLAYPDSMFNIVKQIAKYSPNLKGCGIAFNPGYYKDKGKLFEPYALKTDSGIQCLQVAGDRFDYTKAGFYRGIQEKKANSWVGPYDDVYLEERLISYAVPIYEFTGDTVAVFGVDIDTHNLGDTLNYRHMYPSSFDFLLTADGELIAGPIDPNLQKEVAELVRLINDSTVTRMKSKSGRSTMIDFEINGRDGLVFYTFMKTQPRWQIAVVCYDDEVYASLVRLQVRLLLFSLVAFTILLFMILRYWMGEKKLNRQTLEQERTNGELRIASNIQQELLPVNEPSLRRIGDVRVEGRLIPAKAVGGDLYNAFVRDEKLFFCIGDVSGKGIPSALIMAIIQALFRNMASREDNPAQIMKSLNEAACRNNRLNIFVTLFIGVLDLPTGHLHYCNAGHELPILIDPSSLCSGADASAIRHSKIDAKPNLPVGIMEDFDYEMQTLTMKPGSTIFLYTDGLTEARNADRKLMGREKVLQMITAVGTADPKQLVEMCIAQWREYIGETEQSDDMTLLAVSFTPSEEKEILDRLLTLHNDTAEVDQLGIFVKQVGESLSIDKALTGKIRLAVEEAVVNVMEYAYPKGSKGEVSIRAVSNGKRLKFVITDSGTPFNPTKVAAANTMLSVEERPVGGLGILLVRELMDSINYERIDGKNVLTIRKNYKNQ